MFEVQQVYNDEANVDKSQQSRRDHLKERRELKRRLLKERYDIKKVEKKAQKDNGNSE